MHRAEQPDGGPPGLWLVLPCYRVTAHILQVLAGVPDWVDGVICVDDACPDGSGQLVAARVRDPRVYVLTLPRNQGVGGAVLTGYREALRRGARIIVKADGDGQMDLGQLRRLISPILRGQADYTKGNRFSRPSHLASMPPLRILANLLLSVAVKPASGYWTIFDAANGFTAIEAKVAQRLLEQPVARSYFFETDMLCRLGALRAVVRDVPIPARYGEERSNLRIRAALLPFVTGLLRNTGRRLRQRRMVRGAPTASLYFLMGAMLLVFGTAYGLAGKGVDVPGGAASSGGVGMPALPILAGMLLLLQALRHDIRSVPNEPIHPMLRAEAGESSGWRRAGPTEAGRTEAGDEPDGTTRVTRRQGA